MAPYIFAMSRMFAGFAGLMLWVAGWPALAQDAVLQRTEQGTIDWTQLVVRAEGSAVPPEGVGRAAGRLAAEEAALEDARRRVLAVLGQARLDGGAMVAERLEDPRVQVQARGMLERCDTVSTRYLSDGAVDVALSCPLQGGLASILLPPVPGTETRPAGAGEASGVIVVVEGDFDARLAPVIRDAEGDEVYGLATVGPNALRRWGAVAYAPDEASARKMDRIGSEPMVVRAQVLDGTLRVPDGAPIRDQAALRDGRVVLVVAP